MRERAKIFKNGRVVMPDGIRSGELCVDGEGRIAADAPAEETAVVDCAGAYLFPGMIDCLTHGYGEFLYSDAEPDAVNTNARLLPRHGVTGFVPSVLSLDREKLLDVLSSLAAQQAGRGARVLGLHAEGPCLASPGAHSEDCLAIPSASL